MKENQNRNLERVLTKHLAPVEAPQELWNRVRQSGAPAHTHSMWTAWVTVAATITLSVGGWAYWQLHRENPVSIQAMALSALKHKSADMELRTDDASTVRQWVKANAGIDIPLPPRHSSWVKIVGASISGSSSDKIAEVSYQVGEYQAALLVAKDKTGAKSYPSHEIRPSDPLETARVSSWSMKGQSYTLAWRAPGEARVACLLCHGAEPLANQMPSI